jgi:hypothetical protein
MSEQKGLGKKFLGIFVESDGSESDAPSEETEGAAKTAAEEVAELAARSGARPKDAVTMPPMVAGASTSQDFEAVFRQAGMDPAELDRVKKAEQLLESLPEGTPVAVKRQIVEASLKAFGFEVEKIVVAAQNQGKALEAYVRANEAGTAKAIADAEKQIREHTERIAALRADIEKKTQGLSGLVASTQSRKAQVQRVLEFFAAPASSPAKPG